MSCRIQSHEEITNQTTSLCLKSVRGLALGPAFTHQQSMIRVILRDLYNNNNNNSNMDITQLLMSVGSTEPTNPKPIQEGERFCWARKCWSLCRGLNHSKKA